MQAGWRIGTVFGIPLYIDYSWLIILCLVTVLNAGQYSEQQQWAPAIAWGTGLGLALLLFGSVLLHELGHSLVAQSQGIKVNSITLFIFGGVASIEQESKTPEGAFQVAIAGPAVSFTLFALLGVIATLVPGASPVAIVARDLSSINLVLALFNLIPGLPLDGGQILKAIVWKVTGNRFQAVHWAAQAGKTLGFTAIALGLSLLLLANSFGGIWIALIGWFAVRNANAYDRLAVLQEALLQLRAEDAMTRHFRVVDAKMSLNDFANEYLQTEQRYSAYFAASDGRYRGMISLEDLRSIERSQWQIQTLFEIVHPLSEIITVVENSSLVEVINRMETDNLPYITVLSPAGAVAGIIDRGDIVATVGKKLNLPIQREQIQQIKEEGSYPPGFGIAAIAKITADSFTEKEKRHLNQ
jgi:Zn-dependent protease